MQLEEGKKYVFPVKSIGLRIDRGTHYLTVDVEGTEYHVRAFNFQKTNIPEKINCIYKDEKLRQDPDWYLPLIYEPGTEREFRVLSERRNGGRTITDDENAINHYIPTHADDGLQRFGTVLCRIEGINNGHLNLKVIKQGSNKRIPFLDMKTVLNWADDKVISLMMGKFIDNSSAFASAKRELNVKNPRWILTALTAVQDNVDVWLINADARMLRMVTALISISTHLIENNDFIAQFPEQERNDTFRWIDRLITSLSDYRDAIKLLSEDKARVFIDGIIKSLSVTGYLYEAEHKMRIVTALFSLRPDYTKSYIHNIFDVIVQKHKSASFMSLFQQPFRVMLEIFIGNENRYLKYDDRGAVGEIVTALAILLIITEDMDYPQWNNYRAMLYRYASLYTRTNRDICLTLIHKSADVLLDALDMPLEYGWTQISKLNVLCQSNLAKPWTSRKSRHYTIFEGAGIELMLAEGAMNISPRNTNTQLMINVAGTALFPELDFRVWLDNKPKERLQLGERDPDKIRAFWQETEDMLFEEQNRTLRLHNELHTYGVGEEVTIRILGNLHKSDTLDCRIVTSDGCLPAVMECDAIVGYKFTPHKSDFLDNNGLQRLFKATVQEVDANGVYRVSMRENILRYIESHVNDIIKREDEVEGVVTMIRHGVQSFYIAMSIYGYSFSINAAETGNKKLKQGDVIKAKFKTYFIDNHKSNVVIQASLQSVIESGYDIRDATHEGFCNLMADYSEGKSYSSDDLTGDVIMMVPISEGDYMSRESVREVIGLLDSLSQLNSENYTTAYSYLAVGKILSRMLGDSMAIHGYDLRMRLMLAISSFGLTGKIDRDTIRLLLDEAKNRALKDPYTHYLVVCLKSLELLGASLSECGYLHQIIVHEENMTLLSLARQVLAYNTLSGISEAANERYNLKRNIYKMLNLELPQSNGAIAAKEDLRMEFKQSLFYPAGNRMMADEQKQVKEVMSVIAGFLNTKGGTLYIGADNGGCVTGLHNDFLYLNGGYENYDIQDVQDKFRVKFANGIHSFFGTVNNGINLMAEHVKGEFDYADGKWMFVVTVRRSREAVKSKDGMIWVRQDTSTRPITDKIELDKFATRLR